MTVSGPKIAWLLAIVAAFAVLATLGTQWQTSEAARESNQAVLETNLDVDAAVPGGGESLFSDSATLAFSRAQDTLTSSLSWDSILRPQDEDRNGDTASFAQVVRNVSILTTSDANIDTSAAQPEADGSTAPVTWTRGGNVIDGYTRAVEGARGQTVEFTADRQVTNASTIVDSAGSYWATLVGNGTITDTADYMGTRTSIEDISALPFILRGSSFVSDRTGSGEVIASSADSAVPAYGLVPDAGTYAQESTGGSQDTIPAASSEVDAKSAAEGGASSANWLFAALGLGAIAFGVGGLTVTRHSR